MKTNIYNIHIDVMKILYSYNNSYLNGPLGISRHFKSAFIKSDMAIPFHSTKWNCMILSIWRHFSALLSIPIWPSFNKMKLYDFINMVSWAFGDIFSAFLSIPMGPSLLHSIKWYCMNSADFWKGKNVRCVIESQKRIALLVVGHDPPWKFELIVL